ncbi:MAG: 16S rRNA (guanine(527)-N(7))-methyltransferase RsmG [Acidimicrobiales bacterium]
MLEEARRVGLTGPGPVLPHLAHALGFTAAVQDVPAGLCLDLGSGAGLPGLPLAMAWPTSRWALIDAGQRRAEFLDRAIEVLGLGERVRVSRGRAEDLGRLDAWRGAAELVVARSFGPPALTAECAAPFLETGGRLIVSDSPTGAVTRWPKAGLEPLGMVPGQSVEAGGRRYQVITQVEPCPGRFPRRAAALKKRPLFSPAPP